MTEVIQDAKDQIASLRATGSTPTSAPVDRESTPSNESEDSDSEEEYIPYAESSKMAEQRAERRAARKAERKAVRRAEQRALSYEDVELSEGDSLFGSAEASEDAEPSEGDSLFGSAEASEEDELSELIRSAKDHLASLHAAAGWVPPSSSAPSAVQAPPAVWVPPFAPVADLTPLMPSTNHPSYEAAGSQAELYDKNQREAQTSEDAEPSEGAEPSEDVSSSEGGVSSSEGAEPS
ncbi:hypothetical protein F4777DRAFT_97457 [Nemania sp. FL0916]|nr:hypothetical protein F4777DRAFT_97457 [Nemania sp. FL0916]